jgi:RNA polymerase sigma factor (TIGR02999 family)
MPDDDLDALYPLVYDHLRDLAERWVRRRDDAAAYAPTSIVHEAWEKLHRVEARWNDRVHFQALAARAVRQVLADRARADRRHKRGGGMERVTAGDLGTGPRGVDVLALEEALVALGEHDPRGLRIAELRVYGGCTNEEIARLLDVSLSTVEKDWRRARAWLTSALGGP